jgi:glycosidase
MKTRLHCLCIWILLLAGFAVQLAAQTANTAPVIDKIDPPNWWVNLPSPMLLVHGQHLQTAHLNVSGHGVQLTRTQIAPNGHWALLWLNTATAEAQTLLITAENPAGKAQENFVLASREEPAAAHAGFSAHDVMYLIMTDRFAQGDAAHTATSAERAAPRGWHGGDFRGIEDHLDYLQQLGVTTLWTTPVASNATMPESYHGYAATDLYSVDAHFGTLAEYRHLSAALHERGMKLVIDLVPNHIGVNHPWVLDPPAPEWLHGSLAQHRPVEYDFYHLVDPHAAEASWKGITTGWFTDGMPDLNQSNPLVADYLIQNAIWWIETAHLDGIRLDTFPYVDRAFWQNFHARLHALYPHLTTVGEVFHRDPQVTSYFAGGVAHGGIDTGLDTPFDFPVYFTLRDVLAHDKPMTGLSDLLRQDALYPHPERLVSFIGNHDTTRFLTEAGGSTPRLKLAIGLESTLRGMPQLYAGDEIAMHGGEDPDNRQDFPGGFPKDARSAFTRAGRTATENEVFDWTSALLHLRAAHPALQSGKEENLFADADRFVFLRTPQHSGCTAGSQEDRVLVLVNKSKESKPVELKSAETALEGCTQFQPLLPGSGQNLAVQSGLLHGTLPAESLQIYSVR